MPIQIRNTEIANLQSPDGFNYGLWTEVIAGFQAIPGLVGFWPMSSIQRSTGNVYDLSGQGRTLTYNTGAGSSINYTGLIPYFNLAGGGYLSRADETDLDILGTESFFPSSNRGLTVNVWLYSTSIAANFGVASKNTDVGNQRSWVLLYNSSIPALQFALSSAGTSHDFVATGPNISINTWYNVVGRFSISSRVSIFVNGVEYFNTTSPIASLFNSTAALQFGAYNAGTSTLTGRVALVALSANSLSDSVINGLYQRSRLLFGV